LALVIGAAVKNDMKKKIQHKKIIYTDEPIQLGETVKDVLPSHAEFVFRETTKKVTIALTKRSLNYFKNIADRHDIPYQKMIRMVLDEYAQKRTSTVTP